VRVPHFAMVNLIAGERVVTELVQQEFTAENVVRELNQILPDGPNRSHMLERLAEVRRKLATAPSGISGQTAAGRAADIVLQVAGQRAALESSGA
jgi:lipid-A-disaccharide synthase